MFLCQTVSNASIRMILRAAYVRGIAGAVKAPIFDASVSNFRVLIEPEAPRTYI